MCDTGGKTPIEGPQKERTPARSGQSSQAPQMCIRDTGWDLGIDRPKTFQQCSDHL